MPFECRIPHPLTLAGVRMYAPRVAGVFGISSAQEWVLVGQAENIQEALFGMVEKAHALGGLGFVYEACTGELQSARAARLTNEYTPLRNGSASALRRRSYAK